MLRAQVLGGYRRLLRASRVAFRDDQYAIDQARATLRAQFAANKEVTDKTQLQDMLVQINEAERVLREEIVQARATQVDAATGEAKQFDVQLTPTQRQQVHGHDAEMVPVTNENAHRPPRVDHENACRLA